MDQVYRLPAGGLREIQTQALGELRGVDLHGDRYALCPDRARDVGDLHRRRLASDGEVAVGDGRCGAGCTARTLKRREARLQEEAVGRGCRAGLQGQVVFAPVADGVVVAGRALGLLRAECCYNLK